MDGLDAAALWQVGATVARGVKGYSVAAGLSGEAPLGLLQHWIAAHEEELTASVEVKDSLGYVTYQPFDRLTADAPVSGQSLEGLFGVLADAGYNPHVVSLEAESDLSLSSFHAVVFPSRGFLGLDEYGKLVVTTLRGGALVTFPEPVTHLDDGTPFKTAFLWPYRALERHQLTAPDTVLAALAGLGQRLRALVARLPFGLAGGSDGLSAVARRHPSLVRPATGERIGAQEAIVTFEEGGEVLLRHGAASAGYRAQVRDGTSTVLGTVPGVAGAGTDYSGGTREERLALRRLLVDLLEEAAPRQLVPDDALEVELVGRLSPDGGALLFVINRRGAQAGAVRFPFPALLNLGQRWTAAVEFTAFGSDVVATQHGVRLQLAPHDVLVARVQPTDP